MSSHETEDLLADVMTQIRMRGQPSVCVILQGVDTDGRQRTSRPWRIRISRKGKPSFSLHRFAAALRMQVSGPGRRTRSALQDHVAKSLIRVSEWEFDRDPTNCNTAQSPVSTLSNRRPCHDDTRVRELKRSLEHEALSSCQ